MAGRIAAPLEPTTEQRQELTALIRAHSTPQKLAERARIIILAADGIGVGETAQRLGIWRKTASTWRRRWQDADSYEEHGGAFKRCASLRSAGSVHTGAGLRHYRSGVRRSEG